MKILNLSPLLLFFLSILSTSVLAQIVTISDANFKAYLVGNTAINTNGDTEIQVSEASAFTGFISCSSLSIANLTGIEAFTALTELDCINNQLTNLYVTANTALTLLSCYNNQLTSLDFANGNNTNFIFNGFDATNNPNLTCIQVDDIAYSTTNWTNIDATTSFSTFCTPVSTNKLEAKKLANIQIYPNPTAKDLTINLNKNYQEITISVHNTIGQVVLSKQYTAKQFINLDLEGNSGVYVVTIFTEEGTLTTKVVKE